MASRKRKDGCPVEISRIRDDPRILVDRDEIMRLTKMAKSWEFTCSFCFKKFPSAQAMGGHQNAHRSERLEERRLFVRDPIGYRKRAFLQSMRSESIPIEGSSNPSLNLHAPTKMQSTSKDSPALNTNGENLKAVPFVVMNFLPPKELCLADNIGVGVHAEDDPKGKKCIEFNIDCISLDQKLDLTLKL